jgi:electron transfer flavoprotein alpha subunit
MNPYCRRAVSKGVELARASDGSCTVFTLGPQAAADVLREAIAWGADEGVHLCDAAFSGSDTLATARALAAALEREGPFDLVIVGRNSIDGDTGQVGPEVAELADLPFACGVRRLELDGDLLRLELEHDDGFEEVELALPALISVAERLCEPCKVDAEGRRAVPAERIRLLTSAELGSGPWGSAGSPTAVGSVRTLPHDRAALQLAGELGAQIEEAVSILARRGALTPGIRRTDGSEELIEEAVRSISSAVSAEVPGSADRSPPIVAVVLEPGRPKVGAELLGSAARLAAEVGGVVAAICAPGFEGIDRLGDLWADEVVVLDGAVSEEDVAAGLADWARRRAPWAVLAPSTAFGREVAGRAAAALGAGLVGDAIGVEVIDGVLVAAKPAFSGALVADITCTSAVQLATVRPGVLPIPDPRRHEVPAVRQKVAPRNRVRVISRRRDDDVEVLARAEVVIGVGTGVQPHEYERLSTLAAILGAEMAATRKVTDKGWAPRARQVGITGRSIAPRLYVAIGLSGKFNHVVGVRSAGTVLAINSDPDAPVFGHADVGIVGDWHEVLPLLEGSLRRRAATVSGATGAGVTMAAEPTAGCHIA